jgi:replicative DNA helicase
VGARTGHGKTSMLLNLLANWISQEEEEGGSGLFLFYSMEEPEIRLYHRLLSLLTARQGKGWTIHQIEDYLGARQNSLFEQPLETLDAARQRLRSWEECLQIIYQPDWNVEELKACVEKLAESRKVSAILVDHLHLPLLSEKRKRHDLPARLLAHRLKTLAVQLSCPVVSTVQIEGRKIRKAGNIPRQPFEHEGVQEVIKKRRPQLHHLSEAGIEQEADLVLGLLNYIAEYRAEIEDQSGIPVTTPLEVGTLKNRYGPVGCWSRLDFRGKYGQVTNVENDAELPALSAKEDCIRHSSF